MFISNKIILSIIALLIIFSASAQDVEGVIKHNTEEDYLSVANNLYKNKKYYEAINFYEQALRIKENREIEDAWNRLAICYSNTRYYAKAEEVWLKAFKLFHQRNPDFLFSAVSEQMAQEKYDEAIKNLHYIKKKFPFKSDEFLNKTDALIEKCNSLNSNKNSEQKYSFSKLRGKIDLSYGNISPFLFNDTLYFSSTSRKNISQKIYLDSLKGKYNYVFTQSIFASFFNGEEFSVPTKIKIDDGNKIANYFSLSKLENNICWFTYCPANDTGKCKICYGELNGKTIENINCNIPGINNPKYNYKHPQITSYRNQNYLFFSSDMNIGMGYDIFYIALKNNAKATSAGKYVNTEKDEITPFYAENMNRLFFSSEKNDGFGGFDVYEAPGNPEINFFSPRNAGYGINSGADDYYFSVTNNKNIIGTISSNRKTNDINSTIFDNIFLISEFKEEDVNKKIDLLLSFEDSTKLPAKVIIYSSDSSIYEEFNVIQSPFSSKIKINNNTRYFLYAETSGMLPYFSEIDLNNIQLKNKNFTHNITFIPAKEGAKVVLENVYFEENEFEILPESFEQLNIIAAFMKKNPELNIEIGGHTDNLGSFEYNKELSQKRAEAVKDYLIKMGVPNENLTAKGYSFKKPIADNDSFEGRAKNRRVEFVVVKKQ